MLCVERNVGLDYIAIAYLLQSLVMTILYHYFTRPLAYRQTWQVQEQIHQLQLRLRKQNGAAPDILLLLQHRPTYTSGRRQTEELMADEARRLSTLGADFVTATRGGQLTYHGPGQVVGYPLIDLARYNPTMGARDYVCRLQTMLQAYLREQHGIRHYPHEETGVFLDASTKIASIGVQLRHRLTSHGFAINITNEPLAWFNHIVACGLEGVAAGSVQSQLGTPVQLDAEIPKLVHHFGLRLERDMRPLDMKDNKSELVSLIRQLEMDAQVSGSWSTAPTSSN